MFSGELLTRRGEPYTVKLMRASDVRIERHALIRHEANPYDPSWESYYEGRVQAKMEATLLGRDTLRELCAGQEGRCAGPDVSAVTVIRGRGGAGHPPAAPDRRLRNTELSANRVADLVTPVGCNRG